jgi:hypothetical protein
MHVLRIRRPALRPVEPAGLRYVLAWIFWVAVETLPQLFRGRHITLSDCVWIGVMGLLLVYCMAVVFGTYRLMRSHQMRWLRIKGAVLAAWILIINGLGGALNANGAIIIVLIVLPSWLIMFVLNRYLAKRESHSYNST